VQERFQVVVRALQQRRTNGALIPRGQPRRNASTTS
jgi:hypothetical protein